MAGEVENVHYALPNRLSLECLADQYSLRKR
jgi:hypothetical protein